MSFKVKHFLWSEVEQHNTFNRPDRIKADSTLGCFTIEWNRQMTEYSVFLNGIFVGKTPTLELAKELVPNLVLQQALQMFSMVSVELPPRIPNIEVRTPLEVEDIWRRQVSNVFQSLGVFVTEAGNETHKG